MLGYYLDLALRSLARHKVLTALMVLAIGLGIGASMTMLTVLHVMTADPIPGKSAELFHVQVDPQPMRGYHKGVEPPGRMTWRDAMNLLHVHQGVRKTALVGGGVTVVPPQGLVGVFKTSALYTTTDFFNMFKVPFVAGSGWTFRDDASQARVAVITRHLADRVYGTYKAVGRTLRLGPYDFRVVGVIADWHPEPHFYDLAAGIYAKPNQVFVPLQTEMGLKQPVVLRTSMRCWGAMGAKLTQTDNCAWVPFWVELNTPAQVAGYRQFLVHYSRQQMRLGRFQRPPNNRLRDVMQWLAFNHVVPGSVQLETWLALGFLLVCLVNTVALLLVKFLRRGGELSVRRAMGASRRSVFAQLLIESVVVGLAGGAIGLGLSSLGLWIVRVQPQPYAALAHMDAAMLGGTVLLAVCVTLLAGLFPAWRVCRLAPARLLKTQ